MTYNIIFSHFAENQLVGIYNYYTKEASLEIAQKIIFQIRDTTRLLANNPLLGKREELLLDRKETYRCLIVTNYKIIYAVDEHRMLVKITDIFDVRQNPIKLKRN